MRTYVRFYGRVHVRRLPSETNRMFRDISYFKPDKFYAHAILLFTIREFSVRL